MRTTPHRPLARLVALGLLSLLCGLAELESPSTLGADDPGILDARTPGDEQHEQRNPGVDGLPNTQVLAGKGESGVAGGCRQLFVIDIPASTELAHALKEEMVICLKARLAKSRVVPHAPTLFRPTAKQFLATRRRELIEHQSIRLNTLRVHELCEDAFVHLLDNLSEHGRGEVRIVRSRGWEGAGIGWSHLGIVTCCECHLRRTRR